MMYQQPKPHSWRRSCQIELQSKSQPELQVKKNIFESLLYEYLSREDRRIVTCL